MLTVAQAEPRPKVGAVDLTDRAAVAERALTIARRTALGVLGDREAAADIAQEVAITTVRKAGTLRDPTALDGWVHRVAVRAAIREAGRGRSRRAAEVAHHEAHRNGDGSSGLDDLLALLDGLPPRQRAALTLRYAHDLTDDEIARALGCRPGTVRALLSRGRAALRAASPSASEGDPR